MLKSKFQLVGVFLVYLIQINICVAGVVVDSDAKFKSKIEAIVKSLDFGVFEFVWSPDVQKDKLSLLEFKLQTPKSIAFGNIDNSIIFSTDFEGHNLIFSNKIKAHVIKNGLIDEKFVSDNKYFKKNSSLVWSWDVPVPKNKIKDIDVALYLSIKIDGGEPIWVKAKIFKNISVGTQGDVENTASANKTATDDTRYFLYAIVFIAIIVFFGLFSAFMYKKGC